MIDHESRRRYRRYIDALHDVRMAAIAAEQARGTQRHPRTMGQLKTAAERLDRLTIPGHWKSWQQLGVAIHGPAAPIR